VDSVTFWKLIDASRTASNEDPERQLEEIGALLDALPVEEVVAFQHRLDACFESSYTWAVWGAACVIAGGCSDDGFDDFRGWLISRGKRTFEAALEQPDELGSSITDVDEKLCCQVEGWRSVGSDAWVRRTRRDDAEFPALDGVERAEEPAGVRWKDDDLERLYPKLSRRFGQAAATRDRTWGAVFARTARFLRKLRGITRARRGP
jgi:hypothetical protein